MLKSLVRAAPGQPLAAGLTKMRPAQTDGILPKMRDLRSQQQFGSLNLRVIHGTPSNANSFTAIKSGVYLITPPL